ncbi:MAG: hypothetical protein ABSH56_27300 [Bryobacteraceae bacterium]|jgi:hypothetical protein
MGRKRYRTAPINRRLGSFGVEASWDYWLQQKDEATLHLEM